MNSEAAPRTSLGKRVLTYAATVVVAAIAIYGLSEFLTPVQPPRQGACAFLTGNPKDGRYQAVECDASTANFVALGTVAKSAVCPEADAWDWVPARGIDPDVRFCLAPLYAEGECYRDGRSAYDLSTVDCTDPGAFRVNKISRDVPAPACAAEEKTLAYPSVKLSYCLGHH
ncbi:LppU/SCO3897 family protein [Lentzea sp. NPDC004789]